MLSRTSRWLFLLSLSLVHVMGPSRSLAQGERAPFEQPVATYFDQPLIAPEEQQFAAAGQQFAAGGQAYGFPILGQEPPLAAGAQNFDAPRRSSGSSMVFTNELLPVPINPGNMLTPDAISRPTLSHGFALPAFSPQSFAAEAEGPTPVVLLRTSVLADLVLSYDTGFQDGVAASPSSIALPGTARARRSGKFDMSDSGAQLASDVQVTTLPLQGYLELDASEEGVRFAQAFGRYAALTTGKTWSTFGDLDSLPRSIVEGKAPAGAIYRPEQIQFRYDLVSDSGWMAALAIERPTVADFYQVDANDALLQRAPDLVSNVRFLFPDGWGSSQVAFLMRPLGYEDATFVEHFATGWGLSATSRFKTICEDNLRIGAVYGEGLGSYLFGLNADTVAAAPAAGELELLNNFGAYAGYQVYWQPNLWSNFVYGYAAASTSLDEPDSATKRTQNGWIDLIWSMNPSVAFGLEYSYGMREAKDGLVGENHQVLLSIQVGTPKAE